MAKFVKKPIVVEALQIPQVGYENREQGTKFEQWLRNGDCKFSIHPDATVIIQTLEGDMSGKYPDWVIKGVRGEFYPCKRDIFEASYMLVSEET